MENASGPWLGKEAGDSTPEIKLPDSFLFPFLEMGRFSRGLGKGLSGSLSRAWTAEYSTWAVDNQDLCNSRGSWWGWEENVLSLNNT